MEGVTDIKDLVVGMVLEGVVTNVTNFGAFVDIGVHQDGLVHISMLSESFVKDPHAVVKAGDIVKVKVIEVDVARKRIALTRRLNDKAAAQAPARAEPKVTNQRSFNSPAPSNHKGKTAAPAKSGTMADLFAKAAVKRNLGG